MDSRGIIIEELDGSNLSAEELADFHEVQVVPVNEFIEHCSPYESEDAQDGVGAETGGQSIDEGALINQYVHGQAEFPDHYLKLLPDELPSDEELSDEEDKTDSILEERPTTSKAASTNTNLKKPSGAMVRPQQVAALKGKRSSTHSRFTAKSTSKARSRTALNPQRRRTVLDSALQGLMGQANLAFVRGQYQMAEKICLEIIRQNPMAAEPFVTLAEIYETRDNEKYLNFLTIAAHLNPHDRDQWIRIVELHIAKGNMANARIFYTKAIKALGKDYDLRFRKAQLLEKMNEPLAAMNTYLKMIPHIPPEEFNLCLSTATRVAKYFLSRSKSVHALEAMESAYQVCARHFRTEDINLYLELLMTNKEYGKAIRALKECTNLELEIEKENSEDVVTLCVIPNDFIPEFRTKLCVSLIYFGVHHLLGYLIQGCHRFMAPTSENIHLYMVIAEALMKQHKYVEAIELLRPLTDRDEHSADFSNPTADPTKSNNVSPGSVWLQQAECFRHLNRTTEAIDSYRKALTYTPNCSDAKLTLSALLKQQGRYSEAIKALEQKPDKALKSSGQHGQHHNLGLNARLLYERVLMLKDFGGNISELLKEGYRLLSRTSLKLYTREQLRKLASSGNFYNVDGIRIVLQMQDICADADKLYQAYNARNQQFAKNAELSVFDEYDLFLDLIRIAFENGEYSYCERLCIAMMTAKRFSNHHPFLERITLLSCFYNDDCDTGFSYLRELIRKDPFNASLWNILNVITQKDQSQRYSRFIRRLLKNRSQLDTKLQLFLCCYSMHCNSYKYALRSFSEYFEEQPSALISLCIAACFQQLSLQKRTLRKLSAVGQAAIFAVKYVELRRKEIGCSKESKNSSPRSDDENVSFIATNSQCCPFEQEICYNLGRLYQQANMNAESIFCYERGLSLARKHEMIAKSPYLDLTRHIAFNLHVMYRKAGNLAKARSILFQHILF